MVARIDYALVTPARDEAANLLALAPTVIAQNHAPAVWVIVDDGSADETASVAADLAARHSWIVLIRTARDCDAVWRGRRDGRALLSFEDGIRAVPRPVDLVTKLDADVTLPPDYFEEIAAAFAADPRLGMASGSRCELDRGQWRRRHLTGTAVDGSCRTYRWACWQELQPLQPQMGWDGIDEARAVLAGWRTLVLEGLDFRHHRPMGTRDGSRMRAHVAQGRAAHFMGYRLSYLLLRSLWHARRDVLSLGMLWGFAEATARRHPRCEPTAARAYVRDQQRVRRLLLRFHEARGRRSAN